jgi:hypothetical protein
MGMWMVVTDQATGARITNASFPWLQWANGGSGQYWVNIGPAGDATFSCAAPGYNTLWSNTDTAYQMWLALTKYVPPPPVPPPSGGWA